MFRKTRLIPNGELVRIGIGAKFLTLLTVSLVGVVGTTVAVAVRLFERDQMAMIVVTEDLLTANKASEIGTWLQAQFKLAETGGRSAEWVSQEALGSHCGEMRASGWGLRRKATSSGWALIAKNGDLCFGVGLDHVTAKLAGSEPYEVTLLGRDGEILAHSDPTLMQTLRPAPALLAQKKIDRQLAEVQEDSKTYLSAIARVPAAQALVRTRIDKAVALETVGVVIERSVWLATFFLSVAFMLAYGVSQGIVAPLRRLKEAAVALGAGDYSVRPQVTTRDETRDLAETFNHMSGEIERRVENLSLLHEAAQEISTKLETAALLRTSIASLRGLLGSEKALGFYRGPSSKAPVLDQADWSGASSDLRALLSELQKMPPRDSPSVVEHAGASYLLAPIREQSKPSGFVLFGGNQKGSFDGEDLNLAGAVLSSVGTGFENIRLLRETADKARMEKELETAKHVQNTMFPPASLSFGATQIESFYEPAAECGGDWWGALPLPGGRLVVAIGDATGHGVPSALLTAAARATFSVLEAIVQRESAKAASPALILQLLNHAVRDSAKGKILMTMLVATVHVETGEVVVASASHDPVYRLTPDGEMNVVEVTPGHRLGEAPNLRFEESKFQLAPGETLALYTDGLPEGLSEGDEEYSDRKFQRSLKKHRDKPLAEMRDAVIQDFRDFAGARDFADDITLVLARFSPKS